jgi:hypothetical protein
MHGYAKIEFSSITNVSNTTGEHHFQLIQLENH